MIKDAHSELRPELEFGESLLWSGQPSSRLIFRPADAFVIPFSLVWCGFAVFWTIMAAQVSVLFALFGIPFVLVGLMLVFGRFVYDVRLRKNTYYGITKERILIKSGFKSFSIKTLPISNLTEVEYAEKKDGTGTIYFGPKNQQIQIMGNAWPGSKTPPQFDEINDVKKVYQVIVQLQKNATNI